MGVNMMDTARTTEFEGSGPKDQTPTVEFTRHYLRSLKFYTECKEGGLKMGLEEQEIDRGEG